MLGCGGLGPVPVDASNGQSEIIVTERHQILFQNNDDSQVFEGVVMRVEHRNAETCTAVSYVVQAFAGPGVDLFTIARDRDRHKETLHLKSLADKIDAVKIGEDIHRIYLPTCPVIGENAKPPQVSCMLCGERAEDIYDASGRLTKRHFPDAHGIGLDIRYLDYQSTQVGPAPFRIELRWGDNSNRLMVIRVVSSELSSDADPQIFEDALK